MTALLIIDMQAGSFTEETPRYNATAVIERINAIGWAVREAGGVVVHVQHAGPPGSTFEPGSDGWRILPSIERDAADVVVAKGTCDSFCKTDLDATLQEHNVRRVIVTGCATDFCVDTTIRSAVGRDYEVIVAEDGHTTANRPHLDAASIIQHHNWVWSGLIHPQNVVQILPTSTILDLVRRATTPSAMTTTNAANTFTVVDGDLSGATFEDLNLSGAVFTDVNLSNATFEDTNLLGASFTDVYLKGAQFNDSSLNGATIDNCDLTGMTIDGVLFSDIFAAYLATRE